jgi:hypothetical protein
MEGEACSSTNYQFVIVCQRIYPALKSVTATDNPISEQYHVLE